MKYDRMRIQIIAHTLRETKFSRIDNYFNEKDILVFNIINQLKCVKSERSLLDYLKWQNIAREMRSAVRETLKPTISSVRVLSAMSIFTWNK